MSEFYPVVTVEPELVLEGEDMGSKEKFWYRDGINRKGFLFKYPRGHTGEHWAEKIAAEVAARLDILHARVELAEFGGERGSATKSFTDGLFRILTHGNQLLGQAVSSYDPEIQFRQSAHTLDNIWVALERTFAKLDDIAPVKRQFADYVVLDAVIGNTDRHHENWGQLLVPKPSVKRRSHSRGIGKRRRERTAYRLEQSLAPSFDHASSLGRELRDERRDRLMSEDRVGRYAEKGHGGIYWSQDERRGPSPLELVRRAAKAYPDLFRPALAKLNGLDEGSLRNIVDRRTPRLDVAIGPQICIGVDAI